MRQLITWFDQASLDAGLSVARELSMPILVDFWSPGCKGCEALDTVTYGDPAVVSFINTNFVAIKYNTHAADSHFRVLTGNNALLWTPTLTVLGPQRHEVRRMAGYLSPADLVAELHVALGLVELHRKRPEPACRWLNEVLEDPAAEHLAAEALYWMGVAEFYRNGRSIDALAVHWEALGRRWPGSPWWRRADVPGSPESGVWPDTCLRGGPHAALEATRGSDSVPEAATFSTWARRGRSR